MLTEANGGSKYTLTLCLEPADLETLLSNKLVRLQNTFLTSKKCLTEKTIGVKTVLDGNSFVNTVFGINNIFDVSKHFVR